MQTKVGIVMHPLNITVMGTHHSSVTDDHLHMVTHHMPVADSHAHIQTKTPTWN